MTKNNTTAVYWNDPAILDAITYAYPGVHIHTATVALLSAHRQGDPAPSLDAVYQWVSRKRIPDRWRVRLIYALLSAQAITPGKLFRVGSAARNSKGTPTHA